MEEMKLRIFVRDEKERNKWEKILKEYHIGIEMIDDKQIKTISKEKNKITQKQLLEEIEWLEIKIRRLEDELNSAENERWELKKKLKELFGESSN